MNAMILAAGRGERLRPLTDHRPKPLVIVQGRPVIEHTLLRLARLGIHHVVINACYLAEKLMAHVGDGAAWGVRVTWSHEESCLDTGGGVVHALHHVGQAPFLVINGDILWHMDLTPLLTAFNPNTMDGLLGVIATPADNTVDFLLGTHEVSSPHTILDPQPPLPFHNPQANPGTTGPLWRAAGRSANKNQKKVTYTGIQVLRPQALATYPDEPFSLNRFYDDALKTGRLRGLCLHGSWTDMGIPERLALAQKMGWTLDNF